MQDAARAALAAATGDAAPARARLSHALVELREASDTATGEWRRRTLPHQRVADAERTGHRLLATLVGHRAGGHGGTTAAP